LSNIGSEQDLWISMEPNSYLAEIFSFILKIGVINSKGIF